MPSHQERVRRANTTTIIAEHTDRATDEYNIRIRISKAEIASWPSARTMRDHILRRISRGIEQDFR